MRVADDVKNSSTTFFQYAGCNFSVYKADLSVVNWQILYVRVHTFWSSVASLPLNCRIRVRA